MRGFLSFFQYRVWKEPNSFCFVKNVYLFADNKPPCPDKIIDSPWENMSFAYTSNIGDDQHAKSHNRIRRFVICFKIYCTVVVPVYKHLSITLKRCPLMRACVRACVRVCVCVFNVILPIFLSYHDGVRMRQGAQCSIL